MKFSIAPAIFENYPGTQIGVVVAKGLDNSGHHPEIATLLRSEEQRVREQLAGVVVSQHEHILPWRDAYRKFGAKPKKYPSSIENLLKRVLKGQDVPSINTLVDLYNVISLRHRLPVGGEDLQTMVGDLQLRIAGDDEPPVLLLGEREARPPYPNEVIYADDVGTICRRWNWKEADRTKLSPATTDAILVLEILPPLTGEMLAAAIADLEVLVKQFGGEMVKTTSEILHQGNAEIEF